MGIMSVCAERAPWCYTGGLGDVAAALPGAIRRCDPSLRYGSLTPLYRKARETLAAANRTLTDTHVTAHATLGGMPWVGRVWSMDGEVDTYFLECDPLFDGPGLYEMAPIDIDGELVTPDLAVRFAFLVEAALQVSPALLGGAVDAYHVHDWHAAPLAWRVSQGASTERTPRVALTIHNLAYQGHCGAEAVPEWAGDSPDGFNFLRTGIEHADLVTTVSPRYSREIQTPAFGCGLDALLRERGVVGILNGAGRGAWDPSTDPHLAAPFSGASPQGREACRAALLEEAGWAADDDALILGIVARLDFQKGLDWVAEVVPHLPLMGVRMVLLGTGDPALEASFAELAEALPEHFAAWLAFDVPQSHRIMAGADAVLVPSRFEPCGLTQLYAMRYGAVPIVNAVGGLADTVTDAGDPGGAGNGFVMATGDAEGLLDALKRAAHLWSAGPQVWARLVRNGYAYDSSWDQSARTYLAHLLPDA